MIPNPDEDHDMQNRLDTVTEAIQGLDRGRQLSLLVSAMLGVVVEHYPDPDDGERTIRQIGEWLPSQYREAKAMIYYLNL